MPKVQDPMAIAAYKAGAVHDVCPSIENRLKEFWILGRVVFQIGVLYKNHVTGGLLKASADCRTLSAILIVKNDSHLGQSSELLQNRAGSICRAIVDDDDFKIERQIDGANTP